MIDLQGIITDQANLYPGHFHFFYKINIICVNDMATEASLQLNLGTGGRLEVQVPKNRISVPSFPAQGRTIETNGSICCQVTNIYYFVLIYLYITTIAEVTCQDDRVPA